MATTNNLQFRICYGDLTQMRGSPPWLTGAKAARYTYEEREYAPLNEFCKNQTRPLAFAAPRAIAAACTYYQVHGPRSFDGQPRFWSSYGTMASAASRMNTKLRGLSRQPANFVYPPSVAVWVPQPHLDPTLTIQQVQQNARQYARDTALHNNVAANQLAAQITHNPTVGSAMPMVVNNPPQPAAAAVLAPVLVPFQAAPALTAPVQNGPTSAPASVQHAQGTSQP